MAKLRKMLGKIDSQECIDLMRLIETQSRETLARWAVSYAKENYLPILKLQCQVSEEEQIGSEGSKETFCEDETYLKMAEAVNACESYFTGEIKLSMLKPLFKEVRQLAGSTKGEIAQAAARAVATACATVQTPTNALGYLFYGAAAVAYSEAGLAASAQVYDELATRELRRAFESLKAVAAEDEANPAKINWNC